MRAVAPQMSSPETSKNQTAKESSSLPGIARPGDPPALLVEDLGVGQLGQRDVEDALHLRRVGHQVRPRRQRRQHGHDERPRHHGQDGVDPPGRRHQRRVEGDLLVRLAQRGGRRVLPLVEAPAGEADLAPVRPHARRAPGEDEPGLAALLEERGEHGRVDVAHGRGVGLVDQEARAEDPVGADVLGDRSALAERDQGVEDPVDPDAGALLPRDPGPRRRPTRPPGRRTGDHLRRDGSGHRLTLTGAAGGRSRLRGAGAWLRSRPMTSPAELQAQADALQWYHTIDLGHGVVTKGVGVQPTGPEILPDVIGAERARHRRLGRQVLVPRRAGRGQPGGGARPLRVGRRLPGPGGLLGRVHREGRLPGPVARRDRLLATGPPGAARLRVRRRRARLQGASRSSPTSRPSTSTGSGNSTWCSTSVCCTT